MIPVATELVANGFKEQCFTFFKPKATLLTRTVLPKIAFLEKKACPALKYKKKV